MKFIVDDGVDLEDHVAPQLARTAIAILNKLPDGKLLTMRSLADRVKRSVDTVKEISADPSVFPFKFKMKGRAYFGNQKTIKAAIEQFA